MGVSILMTPGLPGRNFGKQVDITPDMRSRAADVLRNRFGNSPMMLTAVYDLEYMRALEAGASIYTSEEDNIWHKIAEALGEHGSVTIVLEY